MKDKQTEQRNTGQEKEIDDFFVSMQDQAAKPASNLLHRIVSQAQTTPAEAPTPTWRDLLGTPWRLALTFVLPLVVGFSMGFTTDQTTYEIEPLLYADSLEADIELLVNEES